MSISTSDENTNPARSVADRFTVHKSDTIDIPNDDFIIVPDGGTVTITVNGANSDQSFTTADADGNVLGHGTISNLDFDIKSFKLGPRLPAQPES